jgi:hypothetical protein
MQPAAASADGDTGLVPMPKAGQQNSYLRGDGKWIQANNAPTAAVFLHMIYYDIAMANIPTTTYPAFPFNTVLANSGSGFITPTGTPTTKFILAAGCTYKCTASMGYATFGDFTYQWLNNTTNTKFGAPGDIFSSGSRGMLAIGYITTTATTTISLNVNHIDSGTLVNTALWGQYPWCTIEVVSNNNTISAFTGASASMPGNIGYIPAPLAGQQNYYLAGSGTWQPPPKQQYLLAVGSENQLWRKNYMASVWVSFGQCCVTSFCQLRDGSFLGVGVDNAVYTLANLNAKWIYGGDNTKTVKHVTQLSDGTLLGVGMDNQLYTKTTLTAPWIGIPASGNVTSVIQLQDGRIVGIGTDNAMYIKTSLTAGWTYGGDNTKSVSCVTQLQDGSLIGIGLDYKLYSRAHMQANWVYGGDNTCCVKCIVAILL